MKILLFFLSIFFCVTTEAQTKKPTKIKPQKAIPKPPPIVYPSYDSENSQKCFMHTKEQQKDSLIFVEETLLEYAGTSGNARIIITTYNYDANQKKQVEDGAHILGTKKTLQFINGKFEIEKNTLHFTPEKLDKFKPKTFKIVYKSKTKNIHHLLDETDFKYTKSACLEPTISL